MFVQTQVTLHCHVGSDFLCSHHVRRNALVQTAVSRSQVLNGQCPLVYLNPSSWKRYYHSIPVYCGARKTFCLTSYLKSGALHWCGQWWWNFSKYWEA